MGRGLAGGTAQQGQHPPADPAAGARTSRSTVLGLPGAKRRERALSGGAKQSRGAWGCPRCLPASRHSWGPGGGWGSRRTLRGLPVERGGDGREAGMGWHGGGSSTPTPTHLLAPGALLPLREEKPERCISRWPLCPTPCVPPPCIPHPQHGDTAVQHRAAHTAPPPPPTYRLPAGPRHPGEPPLPFRTLRGRGG